MELYSNESIFDFEKHKQKAISDYSEVKPLYEEFSKCLKGIIEKCLEDIAVKCHSIEARAKDIKSFGIKAIKPADTNPDQPKYIKPLNQITDLAGIRVITYFLDNLDQVDKMIDNEFEVLERSNKSEILDQEERLGYQSVHYLVKLKSSRSVLSEYKKFKELIAEIQVRTLLQHAWAEIEHDIEYKSVTTIPSTIKRRFMALAGVLEIADREFQSIQYEDTRLKKEARESVKKGILENLEITPDALKAYLNKKLGFDGRMSEFSYSYTAKTLINMGFNSIKQIDDCIKDFDDDKISRIIWNTRQGQLSRFEDMLLAGLGDDYINRHPWSNSSDPYWRATFHKRLEMLKRAGISVESYKLKPSNE